MAKKISSASMAKIVMMTATLGKDGKPEWTLDGQAKAANLLEEWRNDRWISVDTLLPDEGTFVMASDGKKTIMLYFHEGSFGLKTHHGDVHAKNITYWMPLPLPPVGNK